MATKKNRCACCALADVELDNTGTCEDCVRGLHQIQCGKPMGEVTAPATTPEDAEKAAKLRAAVEAEAAKGNPEQSDPARDEAKPTNGGAVAVAPPQSTIEIRDRGLAPATLNDLYRMAKAAVAGGFAGNQTAEQAFAAMQFGAELGLSPFQSLSAIAVINGKPALYGDGARGIVEASGELEDIEEWYEHQGARCASFPVAPDDTTTAFCLLKRRGRTAQIRSFSVADAKRASLWAKAGPWTQYPQRMLAARAAGFCRRDVFPDRLKGFRDESEARDMTIEVESVRQPERAAS